MVPTLLWLSAAQATPPVTAVPPTGAPPAPRGCRELARGARRPPVPDATSITSAVRPVRVWFDPNHANSAAIAPLVLSSIELA